MELRPACLGMILMAGLAQSPDSNETGVVSGTVMSLSGTPLRRATVQLFSLGMTAEAETDVQGKFTFEGVAPGKYSILANRSGYLNSRFYNTRGSVVTVNRGDVIRDVVIKMVPQSVIAGRVLDDDNEPVPNATVTIRFESGPKGLPGDRIVGSGTTDADGAFSLGNLAPGQYTIAAAAGRASTFARASKPVEREVYVTTYYPDAVDMNAATPVQVTAGAQIRGLEIRLQKLPVVKVSGTVINTVTGEAGSVETLHLIRQGGGPPGLRTQYTGVNAGEFS